MNQMFINLIVGLFALLGAAVIFIACIFAGFKMGRVSQGKGPEPTIRSMIKDPEAVLYSPTEWQEDPYLRATRTPEEPATHSTLEE